MAFTYKILGQVAATANTTHNVYTVPAATQAIISTIVICNRGASNTTFRIATQPAGATLSNTHYIAYDTVVPALDTISLSLGIGLGNTDVLSVNAAVSNLTFSVYGTEIT